MKPIFISKEERARLAIERRQKEAEQKRLEVEKTRELLRQQQEAARIRAQNPQQQFLNNEDLAGPKKRKINDKKVVFGWDAKEDTSALDDPLYANRRVDSFLFGRGKLAGMVDVQPKKLKNEESWRMKKYSDLTQRDYRIMREEFQISTKGGNIPPPIRKWEECGISYKLLDVIDDIGYREPTPIQRQAIPIGLRNRDLLGVAETGSGKTAAFLIPMLEFILRLPPMTRENAADGPYALILAPTRELAQQIEKEAIKFADRLNLRCMSIVGGHSIDDQSNRLNRGVEIIIATPGRLRDLLDRRLFVLNQCTYVVMDEADRMVVDMGFEEDLDYILSSLPVSNQKPDSEEAEVGDKMMIDGLPIYRQTTMFSATMPPAVERIAKEYMRRPAVVTVGEVGTAALTITQRIEMTVNEKKEAKLMKILDEGFQSPIIIFVKTKDGVDSLSQILANDGFKCATLHGGKSQELREAALEQVRSGAKDILVATDVAGRGIDIPDVSLVINYDMPKTIEDYTHRIGRTGRAGKSGIAISLVTPEDEHLYYDLRTMLMKTNNVVPRELSKHDAARNKPETTVAKRKHEETLYLQ